MVFFFFSSRRRHTRCGRDWSSDVCSSDLPKADGQVGMAALAKIQDAVGFESLQYDDQIGKVSLIGAGMRSHPGVSAVFFTAIADAGVNVEMISTSEIRISVVCRSEDVPDAVAAVHK